MECPIVPTQVLLPSLIDYWNEKVWSCLFVEAQKEEKVNEEDEKTVNADLDAAHLYRWHTFFPSFSLVVWVVSFHFILAAGQIFKLFW